MEREAIAESMIPLIGGLYRNKSVVTAIYGRPIINRSVMDLMKAHRFVRHMEQDELSVQDTFPPLTALNGMDIGRANIDIGKFAVKFKKKAKAVTCKAF